VLPPRARRRPLLRHELPPWSRPGPGPDRRRVHGRARSRERIGTRIISLAGRAFQRRVAGIHNDVRRAACESARIGARLAHPLER
jgi:hypothetical protein